MKPTLSIIVAFAKNRVIGADNDMPWHLSTDLKRFKAVTMGKPIIMGRRTFESVGKALPGRLNVVVSRQQDLKLEGATTVTSLEEALTIAAETGAEEIMITGGGQIFELMIDRVDKLYITEIDAKPDGDTYFPEIDKNQWEVVHEEHVPQGEKDSAATRYSVLVKR